MAQRNLFGSCLMLRFAMAHRHDGTVAFGHQSECSAALFLKRIEANIRSRLASGAWHRIGSVARQRQVHRRLAAGGMRPRKMI